VSGARERGETARIGGHALDILFGEAAAASGAASAALHGRAAITLFPFAPRLHPMGAGGFRPMPSVFTRIIAGELPGRFVWKDERCVAFLSINPITPGHLLVVPREEVDHWIDLAPGLAAHLTTVAQSLAKALSQAFAPEKVGLMVAGLEVRHVHFHVLPINALGDMEFANADLDPDPGELDRAAELVRETLRELGYKQVAD
jgi:histidine triad (HIT) family protein